MLAKRATNYLREFPQFPKKGPNLNSELSMVLPVVILLFLTLLQPNNSMVIVESDITSIRRNIVSWYTLNRRMLPWRGDEMQLEVGTGAENENNPPKLQPKITTPPRSAYGVWVSEIMLQQTQVKTVIPYWYKWMARFPTVSALAKATPDEVNAVWAGLGYYRRAQFLLKGAQMIEKEFNGVLPEDVKLLLTLPGIGPYTAGAVSSIYYDKAAPIVDGNIIRVFSRLQMIEHSIGSKELDKECWDIARELVEGKGPEKPSDFNQGLMELGATICTPTNPMCFECPISANCKAYTTVLKDIEDSVALDIHSHKYDTINMSEIVRFPIKAPKKRQREFYYGVAVLSRSIKNRKSSTFSYDSSENTVNGNEEKKHDDEKQYLFVRRPPTGLLANQWEFPSKCLWQEDANNVKNNPIIPDIPYHDNDIFMKDILQFVHEFSSDKKSYPIDSTSNIINPRILTDKIVHIFSHQKHTLHIAHFDVDSKSDSNNDSNTYPHDKVKTEMKTETNTESDMNAIDNSDNNDKNVDEVNNIYRWMTATEIQKEGITSGCKKVLKAIEKSVSTSALELGDKVVKIKTQSATKMKKRKADVDRNQKTLSSFFKKSAVTNS
jgi:A/G-specific adenine glycosylase